MLDPIHAKQISERRRPIVEFGGARIRNAHLNLTVDLNVIRQNVEAIASAVGVDVLAVVKADAYGLGMEAVVDTISDLVAGFCVFQAGEAVASNLAGRTGKRVLVLGPPESTDPDDYNFHHITPTVCDPAQARYLRTARPALCIDTGMQRFSCPPTDCHSVLAAGICSEVFTHATNASHVQKLLEIVSDFKLTRHAAASGLLHDPNAVLDAVRPGLAMYRDAITISSRLVEIRTSHRPAGYSGFVTPRHGVILAGYSHGLRKGPCLINGQVSRVLEVGMQSAFVEVDAHAEVGDDVILLDKKLTEYDLAQSWNCAPHEIFTSMSSSAVRTYVN